VVSQDITRVLLNLFGNRFYAANKSREAGRRPVLKVTTDLGEAVEIWVYDNRTGIRVVHPFFTTKPIGGGTWLGLSIMRLVAE
jgi:C4-dicarboxylate-specific signal transduction histidine kinase